MDYISLVSVSFTEYWVQTLSKSNLSDERQYEWQKIAIIIFLNGIFYSWHALKAPKFELPQGAILNTLRFKEAEAKTVLWLL